MSRKLNQLNLNRMRKLTFIIFMFAFISNTLFAQDLIVTRDAKKIEVKVTEINATDIKYKLFNNLDGPTYTMQKSEISSVIYKNGTIDLFDNDKPTVQQPVEENENSLVRRDFLDLKDKEQEEYLKGFNTELYEKFEKGNHLSGEGRSCRLYGGLGLLTGVVFMASYSANGEMAYYYVGVIELVVGNALLIASIPISIVGGNMKKSVQNEYKEKYLTQTNPKGQFQLQLSGNGLGLAYVF
jgi:hypothetical protein